jgi:hypothetical protein
MSETKRPFNKAAYEAHDNRNKEELFKIMKRLGYELVGDIKEENFKKYDLKFKKIETGAELSFENETRDVFDKIKNIFKTIHIPIRKKNTQADFYIVWNPKMTELFLIPKDVIEKCKEEIVDVKCKEGHVNYEYEEKFIDIPKNLVTLYYKTESGFWKEQKNN